MVSSDLNGVPDTKWTPLERIFLAVTVWMRAKHRTFPPEQREFMRQYVTRLLNQGLGKPAEHSQWHSDPLIVVKKLPEGDGPFLQRDETEEHMTHVSY